ncbi:hypothetical protein [Burkholderia multivorans]|uniref:hypothetical protein n=1 Tax=Burkholderia multivorans TaxID=87883 RepID=UPI00286A9E9B|nr:hypothetical protein [Burkholderia multivorans]
MSKTLTEEQIRAFAESACDHEVGAGALRQNVATVGNVILAIRNALKLAARQPEPSGEVTDVQWWLAELDQYGNPKLSDGAHRERASADKAMYLIKNLGLDNKGKRWAVARVELSEPRPSANGVNMEAVATCRAMVDAARAQGGES